LVQVSANLVSDIPVAFNVEQFIFTLAYFVTQLCHSSAFVVRS